MVKNLLANAGDMGSIPGLGIYPGEGKGKPLQYSCLGNPLNRGPWQATVCGVAKESDMLLLLLQSRFSHVHGTPLQYSCLENPMDGGAWGAAVHGVELDTTERLHFHFSLSCIGEGNGNPFQCSCLENPRDWGEPGGLLSMGSHRVGHN